MITSIFCAYVLDRRLSNSQTPLVMGDNAPTAARHATLNARFRRTQQQQQQQQQRFWRLFFISSKQRRVQSSSTAT
jgi:hypothetical protein